jgi:hypothetical protein
MNRDYIKLVTQDFMSDPAVMEALVTWDDCSSKSANPQTVKASATTPLVDDASNDAENQAERQGPPQITAKSGIAKFAPPSIEPIKMPKFFSGAMQGRIDPSFFEGRNIVPWALADIQQAELAAGMFEPFLKYNESKGFIVFTGVRWEARKDLAKGLMQSLAVEQVTLAQNELGQASRKLSAMQGEKLLRFDDDDFNLAKIELKIKDLKEAKKQARDFWTFAVRRNQASGIRNTMSEIIPNIFAPTDLFDGDPCKLNTPAGTVDLRTGQMDAHNPADLIMKITEVSPSEVGMEKWLGFLKQFTVNDPDLESFLQLLGGICLIGEDHDEILAVAKGKGFNGKSDLFNIWSMVMKDYDCPFSASFRGKNAVSNYSKILFDEAGGAILSWMIDGAKRYLAHGCYLDEFPDCVEEDARIYRIDNNRVSEFIDNRCECGDGFFEKANDLYLAFVKFEKLSGRVAKKKTEFSQSMVSIGFEKMKRSSGITYEGLRLKIK